MNHIKKSNILFRYLLILILGLGDLYLFYRIFYPLTIFPLYFFLDLFYEIFIYKDTIVAGEILIRIIPACVAGAAYYLLFILSLSIPNIQIKKRLLLLFSTFFLFLVLNLVRITILSLLAINNSIYFDSIHWASWHLLSTLLVVVIWFAATKFYNIKEVPLYSDIKILLNKK